MTNTTTQSTSKRWITTASPTIEAVVNPLVAACTEADYIPDTVRILDNPGVKEASSRAAELVQAVVTAHGHAEPAVETVTVDAERDFEQIVDYHRQSTEQASDDETIAIDVTPGRKFMSAIAFQAGIQFGANHLYYLYLHSNEYYDRLYPDIPRPAVDLVDFTEVF